VREAVRAVRPSHAFLVMATGIVSIAMQTIVPASRQTRPERQGAAVAARRHRWLSSPTAKLRRVAGTKDRRAKSLPEDRCPRTHGKRLVCPPHPRSPG